MRIKKSQFKKMVQEEFLNVMREMMTEKDEPETDQKEPKAEKPKAKKPSTDDATVDNGKKEKSVTAQKQPNNVMSKAGAGVGEPPPSTPDGEQPDAPEVPLEDEPADAALEPDVDGEEEEQDGISKELAGKQVSSITMSKESKMMPGGVEIDIKFGKSDSPLKILIGKSGMIKFFYKGALHNEL